MSTPNPALVAAAPSLLAAIQAVRTFIANLGSDPMQVALKFPGALQVLIGNLELQIPGLAQAEFGVVTQAADARLAAAEAELQKLVPPKS